jgi:hypothetical protein
MKTFKLKNNKVTIAGVTYSTVLPDVPVKIKGKVGQIHSISFNNTVMYPISGIFTN